MSYCKVGASSDVSAFFHMMGHLHCETCGLDIPSKGGLHVHLQAHRERGDRVPPEAFAKLEREISAAWRR